MKKFLVVFVAFVSVFVISCDKDDVNEGDVVELQESEIFSVDKTKIKRPGTQND